MRNASSWKPIMPTLIWEGFNNGGSDDRRHDEQHLRSGTDQHGEVRGEVRTQLHDLQDQAIPSIGQMG